MTPHETANEVTPPPSHQQRGDGLELFREFRRTGDATLRANLLCTHFALVHSVARRYTHRGEPLDDLVQEGSIGLLNAIDHFDPDRGIRFSTYATHLITSQILHYLRDCGHLIRQPAWVQELAGRMQKEQQRLAQTLGRDPTPAEVAEALNVTVDSVQDVQATQALRHVVSLTAPAERTGELPLLERAKLRTRRHETLRLPHEDRIVLGDAIEQLKTLERQVVRLYFFGEFNKSEIARKLGISPHYSSYLLDRSIRKLQVGMAAQQEEEETVLRENESVPVPLPIPRFDKRLGLHSQPHFRRELDEATATIPTAERDPRRFALLLIHVDGEGMDPSVTEMEMSRLLRRYTHADDLTTCLGPGLFSLVLRNVGPEITEVGGRLATQIATFHATSTMPPISVYVVAAMFPDDGTSPDTLLACAQQRLEHALTARPFIRCERVAAVPASTFPD